jgi:FMN phosphatase YigB (HAD superfamily)
LPDLSETVFLVDADNTLLDNDRVLRDLRHYFTRELGVESRERYIEILKQLWDELGYRDYLGALQRYRIEHPYDLHVVRVSSWLVDYPFDKRLYPGALEVIARLRQYARTVIVTDGDVVFQPRKLERSGLRSAVNGHALIYIHKERELADIERRYPAKHYVLVDDKPRLLTAFKEQWGSRVTTVFPRQGQYARARGAFGDGPRPDVRIRRISDLLKVSPEDLLKPTNPR